MIRLGEWKKRGNFLDEEDDEILISNRKSETNRKIKFYSQKEKKKNSKFH